MSERAFDITFITSFFIILIFALIFDLMDFIWELIGFPLQKGRSVAMIATKAISETFDVITTIVIGGWTYWVQKKGLEKGGEKTTTPQSEEAKPEPSETKPEPSETKQASPSEGGKNRPSKSQKGGKKAAKGMGGKAAMLAFRTTGLTFLGESIPILGMAPFWTLTVIKTFISVIREK